MIDTAKMSDRGQIIIPKSVRESINADQGTIFAVSAVDEETVVMKKIETDKLVKEFQKLRSKTKKMSPEEIEDMIHETRRDRH